MKLDSKLMINIEGDVKKKLKERANSLGLRVGPYIRFLLISELKKEESQNATDPA